MKSIIINPKDNVAVALEDLPNGIPRGHKFALCNIASGENIIKYGMPIGHAICDISQGEWVHTHNLKTNLRGIIEYHYEKSESAAGTAATAATDKTFMGYKRANGKVGVRNHIFIVPTVGCVNSLARRLATAINAELPPAVDRALALEHPYGCSQLGRDHETTRAILAGLVKHPNAGAVLVLGLGCENNTLESFRDLLGDIDEARIRFMLAQDEPDEMDAGLTILRDLAKIASEDKREVCQISALNIGLKCGGSDGLSGITANPLIGRFSDFITNNGGITILGEVPEMFGSETLLMERCKDEDTFNSCVNMINDFKQYFTRYGQTIYENPSPGNKDGGISTLEDKSLGCTQKAGSSAVNGVLLPGQPPKATGLNLMTGPGNDMVASTLLAASGAQIILFSTGRGTPFGTVVPTLKIATNHALSIRKSGWIDFDASPILDGQSLDESFQNLVLDTASGMPTKNEINFCQEIAIFKDGVTL